MYKGAGRRRGGGVARVAGPDREFFHPSNWSDNPTKIGQTTQPIHPQPSQYFYQQNQQGITI